MSWRTQSIFLGWAESSAWTELSSEVLFSASFNSSLSQTPECIWHPSTFLPTPHSLSNLFIFHIFIFSTLIPAAMIPEPMIGQQPTNAFCYGLTCLKPMAHVTDSQNRIENVVKCRFPVELSGDSLDS